MFKLIRGAAAASGDYLAVLDDDTMLPDNAWEKCLPSLDRPQAGLAFGLPYYVNFANFWSALVSLFVNGHSLLTYIPYGYFIQPITINGMFYVLKRSVFDKIGGFYGLESYLCDDYAVARHVRAAGFTLAQTPLRHAISTTVLSPRAYVRLLTRWFIFPQVSIMRTAPWRELLFFYLFAFLPTFVPLVLLAAFIAIPNANTALLLLFYLALDLWMMIDLNRRYLYNATPLPWLAVAPLLKFLLPLHVIWALLAPRRVYWRGHLVAVDRQGGFSFVRRRV
jgi:ceramide glucosyltransferase